MDRPTWIKSSYSSGSGGNCVEVATLPDGSRMIRDSKNPTGPVITVSAREWQAFRAAM
jgi:Domain of unknown function (DUF397)